MAIWTTVFCSRSSGDASVLCLVVAIIANLLLCAFLCHVNVSLFYLFCAYKTSTAHSMALCARCICGWHAARYLRNVPFSITAIVTWMLSKQQRIYSSIGRFFSPPPLIEAYYDTWNRFAPCARHTFGCNSNGGIVWLLWTVKFFRTLSSGNDFFPSGCHRTCAAQTFLLDQIARGEYVLHWAFCTGERAAEWRARKKKIGGAKNALNG